MYKCNILANRSDVRPHGLDCTLEKVQPPQYVELVSSQKCQGFHVEGCCGKHVSLLPGPSVVVSSRVIDEDRSKALVGATPHCHVFCSMLPHLCPPLTQVLATNHVFDILVKAMGSAGSLQRVEHKTLPPRKRPGWTGGDDRGPSSKPRTKGDDSTGDAEVEATDAINADPADDRVARSEEGVDVDDDDEDDKDQINSESTPASGGAADTDCTREYTPVPASPPGPDLSGRREGCAKGIGPDGEESIEKRGAQVRNDNADSKRIKTDECVKNLR